MAWEQLLGIRGEVVAVVREERTTAPVACPFDGQPLQVGRGGVRNCPWGNYQWPRDGRFI
jgi:hypothetical protein